MKMNFDSLLNQYEKVMILRAIGKEVDCSGLRCIATKCNEASNSFDFKVDGTDVELIKSVKDLVDFIL